jgi:hypothetical protein
MAYPPARSVNDSLQTGMHEGGSKQPGKDWGGPHCERAPIPEKYLDPVPGGHDEPLDPR